MTRSRFPLFLAAALCCALSLLSGCREDSEVNPKPEQEKRFPSRMDLETGEDGLVRLKGKTTPFTGSVVHRNKDFRVTYFAHYQDGKLQGPEVRFYDSGRIYRVNDYHGGKQIHQREWHENGNRKLDTPMVDGTARGPHLRWHENGEVRFDGFFNDKFQWHGRVRDFKEDGTIIWDALFENGHYVSGTYPALMQPHLLKTGRLKPEDAVFSEEEAAAALAEHEAAEAKERAGEKKREN